MKRSRCPSVLVLGRKNGKAVRGLRCTRLSWHRGHHRGRSLTGGSHRQWTDTDPRSRSGR